MKVCEMDELDIWNFKWGVETSARYHDWRRATMWATAKWIRIITLASAVLTLVTALNPLRLGSSASAIVAAGSIIIAIVTLLDLVENYTGKAQQHEALYRRFKELQAAIERHESNWQEHIAAWKAQASLIRADEPPTHWAIYASSWNQTIERTASDRRGYFRQIRLWRKVLGGILHFNPQDFPAV
jgi:hypothetical protein